MSIPRTTRRRPRLQARLLAESRDRQREEERLARRRKSLSRKQALRYGVFFTLVSALLLVIVLPSRWESAVIALSAGLGAWLIFRKRLGRFRAILLLTAIVVVNGLVWNSFLGPLLLYYYPLQVCGGALLGFLAEMETDRDL